MKGHPVMRYFWLLNTIDRHGPVTFARITELWRQSPLYEDNELALRTFHNHRIAISNIFHISIECDEYTNKYDIKDKALLRKNGVASWLLNAFSINTILNNAQSLGSRIQIEEMPSSQHFLADMLTAMRGNKCVEIVYHPYSSDDSFPLTLQPLIVKAYDRRWYLYANKANDPQIKLYALDRILECKILNQSFDLPEDFDPNTYTQNIVGVSVYENSTPVTIRLRAKRQHAKYMRSLPIHHSQREVKTTDKYSDFEIFVSPTQELYQKLLSYHNRIEVLKPLDIRQGMSNYITNMSFVYSHKMEHMKIGKAIMLAARKFPKAQSSKIAFALEILHEYTFTHHLDSCLIYLEAQYGWSFVKSVCLDDAATLAIFESGDTDGIFCFESQQIRNKLRRGVKSIEDLVEINISHRHPKAYPMPYDHALVQVLTAYFAAFIKCHYPREFEIFLLNL